MELVEVKKNVVFCDSMTVSKKFSIAHFNIVASIERTIKEVIKNKLANDVFLPTQEIRNYRNQEFRVYLMQKKFFSLAVMKFKGQKAMQWQLRFIDAFFEMEDYIRKGIINKGNDEWLIEREKGKLVRRGMTDAIQKMEEYYLSEGKRTNFPRHFS